MAVLALDACDAGLMRALVSEGACPNLARLMGEGAVVDTVAPYGTFVGSSWMTISTGVGVGTHRYWNWLEVDPSTYALRPTTPREARRPPFWEALSDAGRRVAVVDVPHADVPERLNGVLLKEWGCHDRHHGTASHPAQLRHEIEQRIGPHPYGSMDHPAGHDAFAPCDYTLRAGPLRTRDEERRLQQAIIQGVHVKRAASLDLLERERWNLFFSVHGESHCVGHQLWHVHDELHQRHDPATRAVLGDPVVEVYRELDASVGAHLERLGEDTAVWVLMNHGMGPHHDGDHLLDEILRRIDPRLEVHRGGRATRLAGSLLGRLPARLHGAARAAVAAAVRRRADLAPPPLATPVGPSPDRSFYPIPGNTTVGTVRFNLAGREAHGQVEPEAIAALSDHLAEELMQVVDLDTGRSLVRAVVPSYEVLERSPDDGLPDLFVEWERSSLVERVWSPTIGTVAGAYQHWRTGDHNDRGMVVVRAPGVQAGHRSQPMSLVDIAPTICATLGVELPGAEGQARTDLVPAGDRAPRRPVRPTRPLRALGPDRPHPRPRRRQDVLPGAAAFDLGVDSLRAVADLERRLAELHHTVAVEQARGHALETRLGHLERAGQVWQTMLWLDQEPVVPRDLVTVITPTHRRPDKLRRAIDSVLAQRYPHWELVVVDDGDDAGKSVVAEVGDDRIVYRQIPHGGTCAARNVALDVARGSIVTYLDDDNTLHPGWLHAAVWGFHHHPEHDVLYGARVFDDEDRSHARGEGGFPWLQLEPFDRVGLEQHNMADMGVIAHRAGIAGARFDEAFWECGDWDFFLSITQDQDPLMLPVVAFFYRTDGEDRATGRFVHHADLVREKWARRRAERPGGRASTDLVDDAGS